MNRLGLHAFRRKGNDKNKLLSFHFLIYICIVCLFLIYMYIFHHLKILWLKIYIYLFLKELCPALPTYDENNNTNSGFEIHEKLLLSK